MVQQAHRFFGVDVAPGFRPLGTRPGAGPGPEWSVKDWKWDGDLFIATPLDPAISSTFQAGHRQFIPVSSIAAGHSSNTSSSCSDDTHPARELDQRKRKVVVVDDDGDSLEDEEEEEEPGGLTLKLGGGRYPVAPASNEAARQVLVVDGGAAAASGSGGTLERLSGGKKPKIAGGSGGNRAVCQVEDCGADLTSAKDYHRRHKVCEMHSKASKALVGNVMQRFCQQCSRFHSLQEFDEGKRSCRRRLAGHNKRRRKTQPDPITSVHPGDDEQASNYILISLLRLLSNMHGNTRSDPVTDQDQVAHLLRSLASCSGGQQVSDISGLLHESQKLLSGGLSIGNSEKISTFLSNAPPRPPKPIDQQHRRMSATETPQDGTYVVSAKTGSPLIASPQKSDRISEKDSLPASSEVRDSAVGGTKLNNFDLNDMYVDSDDGIEDVERSPVTGNFQTGSVDCPSWARHDSQQSSPPQISGNSDSASALSPSSSGGEAQSRTDRIVFKLFGKEPNEFPLMLRSQILDWLAHSPTDMESYIRPGCVILTVYVRLAESIWEEVCSDLGSSLSRFLDMNDDNFWQTGWVVVRLQNQIAFVQNGQIAVNTLLPLQSSYCSRIFSVTPIAVATSEKVQFQIKGSNLSSSTSRLLCAMEGKYLALEDPEEAFVGDDALEDTDDIECVSLQCSIPSVIGRGFVEVEDDSIGSNFFPFIVAEKDVCSEIRMLESEFDSSGRGSDGRGNVEAKNQAMGFINEMGWLLHRCGLKSRLSNHENPNVYGFSFERFTWLMEFSMEHAWSAVVKKLLDVLVDGMVDMGKHSSAEAALSEICLLHKAVRRNSRPLVELLLRYVVRVKECGSEYEDSPATSKGQVEGHERFLFKPDARGPANLTPLHLAAGRDGSMEILDALTDDPGKVGIEAWKNAHDSTGCTPEDYARLRGHYAYIHLVKRKMNKRLPSSGSVAVDIPDGVVPEMSGSSKQRGGAGTARLEIGGGRSMRLQSCSSCCTKKQISYSSFGARSSLVYRPAMLSMVGIAAVCVCVALLFKSLPDVNVFFRWEMVDYGSI